MIRQGALEQPELADLEDPELGDRLHRALTSAEDGEQAQAAVAKQRPNLILMNIQLLIYGWLYSGFQSGRANAYYKTKPISPLFATCLNWFQNPIHFSDTGTGTGTFTILPPLYEHLPAHALALNIVPQLEKATIFR